MSMSTAACFSPFLLFFFFFNDTATTEIYTLSLHDALPISWLESRRSGRRVRRSVRRVRPAARAGKGGRRHRRVREHPPELGRGDQAAVDHDLRPREELALEVLVLVIARPKRLDVPPLLVQRRNPLPAQREREPVAALRPIGHLVVRERDRAEVQPANVVHAAQTALSGNSPIAAIV